MTYVRNEKHIEKDFRTFNRDICIMSMFVTAVMQNRRTKQCCRVKSLPPLHVDSLTLVMLLMYTSTVFSLLHTAMQILFLLLHQWAFMNQIHQA